MSRSLRLAAPNASYSEALIGLENAVDDVGAQDWLGMIDAEWGLLIAMCRSISEKRKEARETSHA
jgi:hypothetical protein